MKKIFLLVLVFSSIIIPQQFQLQYSENSKLDPSIPKPADILGFEIGEKPIRYTESVIYLKALAEKSKNVKLFKEGKSHQGRDLYYLIISSERNLSRIDEIKSTIKEISEPIDMSYTYAQNEINNTPAVALMMYTIHGNESSGTDASIKLAYRLAADNFSDYMLDKLIIIIYPIENPDGRERFLSQVETWRGKVRNSDTQSMPHSGVWPSGRTNHYHFDLNRDWFILSQPETRARVKILREWNPQLVVDAHEMGPFSSFLFNPPREPINPNMHEKVKKWWGKFAQDQATAFDQYGWSYYTGEWLEEWYPGYGSSYPSYSGAISILYEQARTSGIEIKRPDNTILTFKEAVQHQFISSLANLQTLVENKNSVLLDFYSLKKESLTKPRKDGVTTFIIGKSTNETRLNTLLEKLLFQGIEIYKTDSDMTLNGVKTYWDNKPINKKFEKGSYVIPVKQPMQPLINAILEFDTRMDNSYLKTERESLEKGEGTRLYEVSSWSVPLAYGLDVYKSKVEPQVKMTKIESVNSSKGKLKNPNPKYGYVIEFKDDNVYKVLLDLFDRNINVRSAEKKFKVEDRSYDRGTLLIRKIENNNLNENLLKSIAEKHGIEIIGVNTALAQSGYDLGGDYFTLLRKPKVAIFNGLSTNIYNFGVTWHLLDQELNMRASLLHTNNINRLDLRKYNTIIIPSYWGSVEKFKNELGKAGKRKLQDWIKDGGTLIAINTSAAAIADTSLKMSNVKLRRQSLTKLDQYDLAYSREQNIYNIEIDSVAIWEGKATQKIGKGEKETKDKLRTAAKQLEEADSFNRRFSPRGAILNVKLNKEHWLNFGLGDKIPALFTGSYAYLSKKPVQTAARFSEKENLRLSGLLWPEAKERVEKTAYLTREASGNGQIILFAFEPNFRTLFKGTQRLLLNSIFLGPGFGTRQPVEW